MKSILELSSVKKALEQVVAQSNVNNGTNGMELFCHYWSQEEQYDKMREDLQLQMGRAAIEGRPDDVVKIRKLIESLPPAKIIMEFKLMTPIPVVRGTKTIYDGEKKLTITATNVRTFFIHEDSLLSELGVFEETEDIAKDSYGNDQPIIKLRINKGILDVKEAAYDNRDDDKPDNLKRIIRPQRVYLTAVSYATLQVVGRMKMNEKRAQRRRFGFDESI